MELSETERQTAQALVKDYSCLQGNELPQDAVVCADLLKVLPLLPKGFADLVIIDPPYNLTKQYAASTFRSQDEAAYRAWLETWLPHVCDCLKDTGSLYLCCDWHCSAAMYDVLGKYLTIVNRITWQREKGRGASRNWKNGMEDIWFAVKNERDYTFHLENVKVRRRVLAPYRDKGQPKDWNETAAGRFRDTCPSNFWDDITVPFWSMAENTVHPTQKPEKLVAKLLLASSNAGDLIFDPFLGSGTTAAVARKLGRHCIGIEREMDYCALAVHRLLQADRDQRIQGYADGVFWERNSGKIQ